MDWWLGFNQCWSLGATCAIDWDAWTVVIAVFAAVLSWLSVLVTAVSAGAVFWLGRQANLLAGTAKEAQERYIREGRKEAADDRDREGKVVLAYCSAELKVMGPALAGLAGMLRGDDVEDLFVRSRDFRRQVNDRARELSWEVLEKVLPRLHAIPPATGMRLARLLGACKSLTTSFAIHADEVSPHEREDGQEEWEEYLRTSISNRLRLLLAARELANSLWLESNAALEGIGERG
ncbi:hypothetical protein [Stenotrophomonas maltophilia]|uniref:hypothetical protein n=1 Tax=Stenotrophomonas maltophilia TaxID=40324 RepID=UPI000A2FCC7D|nr:hypothetical protein [Stenotrophomonas maltophilia]ARQ90498.1 hypothetical protein A7326_13210 [Stenotrophomonas maltophilia]